MKKTTPQTNEELHHLSYLTKFITNGLKVTRPSCPSCNKRIISVSQVGTFGMDRGPIRDTGYLLCKSCTPHITKRVDRIARRMEKRRPKYWFPRLDQVEELNNAGIQIDNFVVKPSGDEGVWVKHDSQFFQKNHLRTTYLRRNHVGEFENGLGNVVLVRQLSTETYLRLPIKAKRVDIDGYDEEFCCMLWEILQSNGSASESAVERLKRGSFHA